MSHDTVSRVYTSGEVARICGVSADTVSRWFDLGQIEGFRLGAGGDRRIPHENLKRFMIKHGIPLDRLESGSHIILIVDDDPHYLNIIPKALASLDEYEILTTSTGFEAGALVAEHNPRLLILDIQLSDMDGRAVATHVKSRPETRTTRLIAISGFIDNDQIAELKSHGFDDFLKKPFQIEELTQKVEALLELPDRKIARPTHDS